MGFPLPCPHYLASHWLTPISHPLPAIFQPVLFPPEQLLWRCLERKLRPGEGLLTQISWTDGQLVLRNCQATGNLHLELP